MAESDKLFLPVPHLKLNDMLDWQKKAQREHRYYVQRVSNQLKLTENSDAKGPSQEHKKCFGNQVDLNDERIALFRIGKEVYATQATCPHAGGPLYLADIEELVPGQVCLKCPWHKWTFNIDTGESVKPKRNVAAKIYPTRVDKNGQIYIGFDSFGQSAFEMSL